MNIITIFALAVALGTDAFSVCVGLGMGGISRRQMLIFILFVTGFHIIMPLTGYIAGAVLGRFIGRAAGFAGALVLVYLGIKMILGALRKEDGKNTGPLLTSRAGVILLTGSVSLDALSVGFTLGTQRVDLGTAALIMGLVAGSMAWLGIYGGRRVGGLVGEKAVFVGGPILVLIGIKLLFYTAV